MNSSRHFIRRLAASPTVLKSLRSGSSSLYRISNRLSHHLSKPVSKEVQKLTPLTCSRLCSTAAQKFELINIQDEEDFKKRVLEASYCMPIVVDFHATWCGPCKLLGPRLEAILSEEEGKVVMAKVDIDDHSDLAMDYGVRSVPTVIGVKNGKIQSQFIGLIDDDKIRTFVDKLIIS